MFKHLLPVSAEEVESILNRLTKEELVEMWRRTGSLDVAVMIQDKLILMCKSEQSMYRELVGDKLFEQFEEEWNEL